MPGLSASARGPIGRRLEKRRSGRSARLLLRFLHHELAVRRCGLRLDGGDRTGRHRHHLLRHRLDRWFDRLLGGDARLLCLGDRGFRRRAHRPLAQDAQPWGQRSQAWRSSSRFSALEPQPLAPGRNLRRWGRDLRSGTCRLRSRRHGLGHFLRWLPHRLLRRRNWHRRKRHLELRLRQEARRSPRRPHSTAGQRSYDRGSQD